MYPDLVFCGGLWMGQMLLVCSTYVSVMCMYCVLFHFRRKLRVTETSVLQNLTFQLKTDRLSQYHGQLQSITKNDGQHVVMVTVRQLDEETRFFNAIVTNHS